MPRKKLYFETTFCAQEGKVFECIVNCDEDVDEAAVLNEMQSELIRALQADIESDKKIRRRTRKSCVEKIISSVIQAGELMFMVKHKDKYEISFVPAKAAKAKFPHLVLDYFQRKIDWHPLPSDEE